MLLSTKTWAAHQVQRPISNGLINQTYLWATETTIGGQVFTHKGVDFQAATGTDVYAAADGVVVDLNESIANNDHTTSPFGNFVLIRHNASQRDWDQKIPPNGGVSFTYSMYLHLSHNSVVPNINDQVSAGSLIAKSGNTGNSTGPHLHFQIVLNPLSNAKLTTLDSGIRSRNPELWLRPLASTGAMVGKITNPSGSPITNLVVCGVQKQTQNYISSRTYSFDWANSDGIFRENFGTTDIRIQPGVYNLRAYNLTQGCSGSPIQTLGYHTFSADTVTYVGLYPAWLPIIRPTPSWDAQTFIRDNATGSTNVSFTSFFSTSTAIDQQQRTINAQGTAVVDNEPAVARSGIVVPNLDSSVLVVTRLSGQPAGYSGIIASHVKDDTIGSPGWEQAGSAIYAPLVKKGWYNRWSEIHVTNTGMRPTTINVTYYSESGIPYSGGSYALRPNASLRIKPEGNLSDGIYSAVLTNADNQPMAAVVLEGENLGLTKWPAAYNASSSGGTVLYGPLIKKNYLGNTTGITLQNIGTSQASFQARYYDMNGNQWGPAVTGSIPAKAPYVLYNPIQIPDGFLGSVRITSTSQHLVGQMSEGNGNGGLRLMSNLVPQPTPGQGTKVFLPLWYDNYTVGGSWMSGVNIRNAGTGINHITATWFNQDGNPEVTRSATLTNANDTHNFYDDPELNNFVGSVMIQSLDNQPIVAVSNVRN